MKGKYFVVTVLILCFFLAISVRFVVSLGNTNLIYCVNGYKMRKSLETTSFGTE